MPELGEVHGGPFGQGMPVVKHGTQRFTVQRHGMDAAPLRRDGCREGKVHVPGGQLCQAFVPWALPEFENSVRVAGPEGADEQGQRRLAESVLERDPNAPPDHIRFVPNPVQPGLKILQCCLDIGQQRPGCRCQPDPPAIPDQQVHAHYGARPGHSPADR
ncbi:hypothetical protein AAU01_35940 [Paenarthrobacter aurescens]|uniref:Uncharacterized protein n=1 Tax=Paenarthrobacter aurescens TaxID=43663 RepID=A0A4Y3NQ13_PAEAU|nr:hypothetical protein AAU01_35940 [Paenarthrobacter aurescens]